MHMSATWRRTPLRCIFASLIGISFASGAQAETYPHKPIAVVVGFVPGGGLDYVARLLAQNLSKDFGQSAVVENRPGASGEIAATHVARSAPDGYTLLVASNGALTISPTIRDKLQYKASDLEPVALMTKTSLVLVMRAEAEPKTLSDLVKYATSASNPLTYATPGAGTVHHLAFQSLANQAGFQAVHIPYKGGSQAINDVMSGHVDMMLSQTSVVQPLVQAGKLKALAISSADRSALLPGIPTISETIPGFSAETWSGLFVPAGTRLK